MELPYVVPSAYPVYTSEPATYFRYAHHNLRCHVLLAVDEPD